MNATLIRVVFSALIAQAIFASPSQGIEAGPKNLANRQSRLKTADSIRPTRPRFNRIQSPSFAHERVACKEGGDGDDRRPASSFSVVNWPPARPVRPSAIGFTSLLPPPPSAIRIRC